MSSLRLTKSDRESVVNMAVKAAFEKKAAALAKQESELAIAAYEFLFPEKVRKLARSMPDGWLSDDSCLRLTFRGMQTTLKTLKSVRVPSKNSYGCNRLGTINDEDLTARFLKLEGDKEDVKRERSELSCNLEALLNRMGTLRQLSEGWPEGVKFYAHLTPRETAAVPMIQIDVINKALGLPLPRAVAA